MSNTVETSAPELGLMIVRTSGVLGGKPRLKGHRVGVHRVAGWWKLGLTVEEIGERLSSLTPAEIHTALAYYHLHREEIEGYLEAEHAVFRSLEIEEAEAFIRSVGGRPMSRSTKQRLAKAGCSGPPQD
jgi:uncharacterized protein (DUF433 family)